MAYVLIVEDEETNAQVASVICQGAGHAVAIARNGQEALEILTFALVSEQHFDVLLVDVLMPVMDGLELTRTLRADARFTHLPIIGVTAKASKSDLAECLAAGMDQVLTKPYRNKDLRAAVENVLMASTASV